MIKRANLVLLILFLIAYYNSDSKSYTLIHICNKDSRKDK